MRKQLLYIFLIFCFASANAQDALWQKVTSSSVLRKADGLSSNKLYYRLNANLLSSKLASASSKTAKTTASEITIPNADGNLERFSVWESSNFAPELQAKYPEIRAYEGRGIDDKNAKIHFSVAPIGMQTMVFRPAKPTEYIEQNPENKSEYVLFRAQDNAESKMILDCKTTNLVSENKSATAKTASNAKQFKTLRLALSCTGEYAAYFGGTVAGALAGMNATLTRVNGIFGRDLSVKVILIANNNAVIYTDASTDPYSIASVGATGDNPIWMKEVQTTLTNVIGEANYDIGHLFGASGGGGNAGCIGCVCVSPTTNQPIGKGSAFTSPADAKPEGDNFDIDFVAHEMGHQLGGSHTFSFQNEGNGTCYEPGSGSTIMGYAGVTKGYNIQDHSDAYFSYASINQIQNNLAGKTCPVTIPIDNNNPPVIKAGLDYTIPISTPFILKGTGSDPEGNTITYSWEQYDSAMTTFAGNSFTYATKPDGPMFRSFSPTTSPVRYMPALSSVLNNQLTTSWESVSSIGKTMNFTLTGRDNAAEGLAQTNTDAMVVTVNAAAGPFAVTSQKEDNLGWAKGSAQTITWSVNNTNTLPGSSNVNIKLSLDGGLTFPIVLASNTPNDGSETILIPSEIDVSTNCRLLIEPVDNIYYAVNSKPFALGYTVSTSCTNYNFEGGYSLGTSTTFINKTVTVPASTGTISDVNVSVNVKHERFEDLEIEIESPSGTIVSLFNKSCGTTNSTLALQFDDSGAALNCGSTISQIVIPASALSAFNGENPQGNWTFKVRDAVVGMFGTINSASVNICTKTYTLGNSDFENVDFIAYPNPNKGSFTVQFNRDSVSEIKVYVNDIVGKYVYDRTFQGSGYFIQDIQLPNVPSGLYFLTVTDGQRKIVKKILVN
ncbi:MULTISPECIES: reprolysin-like metallopeptidase [Flavobacterium]|uniref:Zinc-dependent metalloprotease family protein n=1 Tax=Flavobacterium ginsengisoli TaxID=871694 RepID=A0ABP7G201_9FLAO|nr:zinc-dependent metalloprotease family protein [Flavobacterium sp. IB48]MBJ2123770.1 proprotein convertase P-domain-containing protein [Flavobacterium sp. IB48]